MTKYEKIIGSYLLIFSIITVSLNIIILNKKTSPPKAVPSQQTQTTNPLIKPEASGQPTTTLENSDVSKDLVTIKNELSMIKALLRDQNQTLGVTDLIDEEILSTPAPQATPTIKALVSIGSITLKASSSAEVFKEKTSSSTVVGKIIYGRDYPFYQKQDNWYFLKQTSFQGWINSSFVKEVN